jgi:hypothetical protein
VAGKTAQQEKAKVLREKWKRITREYQRHTVPIKVNNDMKARPANAIHTIDDIVNDMVHWSGYIGKSTDIASSRRIDLPPRNPEGAGDDH